MNKRHVTRNSIEIGAEMNREDGVGVAVRLINEKFKA